MKRLPRGWIVVTAIAVLITGAIAIAGSVDIISRAIHPRVECQDSEACRAFITAQIAMANAAQLHDLRKLVRREVVAHSGNPPGHQPGPGGGHHHPGGNPPPHHGPKHHKPPPPPPPPCVLPMILGPLGVCITPL